MINIHTPSKEVGLLDVGGGVAVSTESLRIITGFTSPDLLLVGDFHHWLLRRRGIPLF